MKKKLILILVFFFVEQNAEWSYGNIHIFGDSHSAYSFTNLYSDGAPPSMPVYPITYEESIFKYQVQNELLSVPFQIHWISNTMHVIGQSEFGILDFKKYGVGEDEVVVLHFGGIDSYHGHLEKQFAKGRKLEEIVETLAQGFIKTVIANYALYDRLTVVIMAVLPPIIRIDNKNAFVNYSFAVSYEEFVVRANRMLNEVLARHCQINNLLYFNVNVLFEDSRGILNPQYADEHHVRPCFNYLIKQRLINLILENSKKMSELLDK